MIKNDLCGICSIDLKNNYSSNELLKMKIIYVVSVSST